MTPLFQKSSCKHQHVFVWKFGHVVLWDPVVTYATLPESHAKLKLKTATPVWRRVGCFSADKRYWYAAIIKCKLSSSDCFLGSFSLPHSNALPLLLCYLELLCRHFYRCTRDSFNTKQKFVPTSKFWFFISFVTMSRLYPGPGGPPCDLSFLVGSCKPHFTNTGWIHTNKLHVSINKLENLLWLSSVRSPACAAASRTRVYGSCTSMNTSLGIISKPHL